MKDYLDLPFGLHHEMNSGPSSTVPDSSGAESEDLQGHFSGNSPSNSQVITNRGSSFTDHSWS